MDTFEINNRRYLGSKYKLLTFLNTIIESNTKGCRTFFDVFAGTGVVANYFNNKYKIIVNDNLKCNYYVYKSFLGNESINIDKIQTILDEYNNKMIENGGYYAHTFKDTFLSYDNLKKVDFIRDDIDDLYHEGKINTREKAILITSLIYAVDKIANTVGHYDSYRKNGDLTKPLIFSMPKIKPHDCKNEIYNMDANELVNKIIADIAYIDPPYNSRQYCDMYHFLENIALNMKSKVFGVTKKMGRSNLKSKYSTKMAKEALTDLIDKLRVKYILLSYNNVNTKATARSNAKIIDEDIHRILKRKGTVFIFEKNINPYTTGATTLKNYKERIFLCKVNEKFVQSPLNYTGGKYKLLPQIVKYFPPDINTFYDVFCGGFNVGSNIIAKKIIGIDINKPLISLLNFLKTSNIDKLLDDIEQQIIYYKLSRSSKYGYAYYDTNSTLGLATYNKVSFLKLRMDYNKTKDNLLLLLLIFYGFNNQLRFNRNNFFNLPVGKRDFNARLKSKLMGFVNNLKMSNIYFETCDFRHIDLTKINKNDFMYFDPPYILGKAFYNENNGWNKLDEEDLLNLILNCSKNNIRFALSNVICHKGKTHNRLLDWCMNRGFKLNHLKSNYQNVSYHGKHKACLTDEVLITNF